RLNKRNLRRVREEVVKRVANANTKAMADHLEVSKRTVSDIKRTVASANSPKGGGTDMSTATTTAIIDRLDRIERLESMRAETMDRVRETLDELAAHFLGAARIQLAVG